MNGVESDAWRGVAHDKLDQRREIRGRHPDFLVRRAVVNVEDVIHHHIRGGENHAVRIEAVPFVFLHRLHDRLGRVGYGLE